MPEKNTPADAYEGLRRTFIALARRLAPEDLERTVPATPAWTVHDVLAHVVGITADLNASEFGDGDADDWTARQVEVRRGRAVEELVDEWNVEAPAFEGGLELFGNEVGMHYVGDLAQHIIDVQAALDVVPSMDAMALRLGLDFYLGDLDERLSARGIGVELLIDDQLLAIGARPPAARVQLSAFEAFRAIGGRRSLAQLRSLPWDGESDQLVDVLSAYPVPAVDLVDGEGDDASVTLPPQ